MQHMKVFFTLVRGFLFLSLALGYIIHSIFDISLANYLVILVVLAFLVSWPVMSPFPKIMSAGLVIFGNLLFFLYSGNLDYWKEAILNNVGLVSLFISVPLLSYPLRNGGYIGYVDDFVRTFLKKDMGKIGFVTAIACIASSFLNLGSLRVVYDLFSNRFKNMNKIFAMTLIQGFSLAAFWSPYFAGVAIALHLVGVKFISFMFYGIVIVMLSYVVSFLMSLIYINKEKKKGAVPFLVASSNEKDDSGMNTPVLHKKGIELIVVFIGLFLSLFFLERILNYNVLLLITLVAFTYPIIWSFFIKKIKEYVVSMKDYVMNVVPNIHNESIMIISATFFSQMVRLTSFPDFLSHIFLNISHISVMLTVLSIILISVVTAFFIHQVLPISVFATTLSPEIIGLKPELFVLTLVISWGLIPLLSPVSAANLIVGNLFRTKTFEIGIWNVKYVLVIIFLASIVISLLNQLSF